MRGSDPNDLLTHPVWYPRRISSCPGVAVSVSARKSPVH